MPSLALACRKQFYLKEPIHSGMDGNQVVEKGKRKTRGASPNRNNQIPFGYVSDACLLHRGSTKYFSIPLTGSISEQDFPRITPCEPLSFHYA